MRRTFAVATLYTLFLFLGACRAETAFQSNPSGHLSISTEFFKSVHVFSGGGLRPPNSPQWEFNGLFSLEDDGRLFVDVELNDSLCFQAGHFDVAQSNDILKRIDGLKLYFSKSENLVLDAGTTFIQVNFLGGGFAKIFVSDFGINAGELYAVNGQEFFEYITQLVEETIPMGCQ